MAVVCDAHVGLTPERRDLGEGESRGRGERRVPGDAK
jgi:hypothetical protein